MQIVDWEDGNRYLLFKEFDDYMHYLAGILNNYHQNYKIKHEKCIPPIKTTSKWCMKVLA